MESVVYNLHATYDDPVVEADDPNESFTVEITSYGDFDIRVEAQAGSRVYVQRAALSDLLKEGHPDWKRNSAIKEAIDWIKNN